MPSGSKKQQKFFGIVKAIQEGKTTSKYSKKAAKVAETMKPSDVEEFAATKRKGLPVKVKKVGTLKKLKMK